MLLDLWDTNQDQRVNMNRILRRPMFRRGGSTNEGITSGLDAPRQGYKDKGLVLPYDMSQMFPTETEMSQARKYYRPYFEREKGEGLNRFLMNFGLDLMSRPPQGGFLSTAAAAAKKPVNQLFEDLDRERLQKNVADSELFTSIMEQKGNILSEAAGSDKSSDLFKDQALMNELEKIVPQISATIAELEKNPDNQELQDKLAILEGKRKIILGDDPISEASLEIFKNSPQGQTLLANERKKLLAENPDKYMTDKGVNEVLLVQDSIEVLKEILRGVYSEGGRVGLQMGGQPMMEQVGGQPMMEQETMSETTEEKPISSTNQMEYETLRARLPQEITDDVVKLLSVSPEAFEDFAMISTQQDVDNFNKKYDVNLVLPAEA